MKRTKLFWLPCLIGLWTGLALIGNCSAQGVNSPRELKSNSISRLESIRTGDKSFDKEIDRIIQYLRNSLEDKKGSLWIDDWHLVTATNEGDEDEDDNALGRGLKVFHEEKKALKRMLKLTGKIVIDDEDEDHEDEDEGKLKPFIISPEAKAAFEKIIKDLILADRLLAESALYQAKVYQGIDKKIDHEINKSEQELTKAQNELQKDRPDKAIKKYEKSWEHAQLALKFVTPEIATQATDNWLSKMEEAFTFQNQEQLFEAAAAIIEIGKAAIPSLVNVVQDKGKDIEFRSMAIELLSNVGDETAVGPLISILTQEETEQLRDAAALALGILGYKEAVTPLMEAMNDSSAEVRQSAALSLGILNDPKVKGALVTALSDEDSMVRTDALRALGELKAKDAIPQIVNKLDDQDNYVRYTAAIVLGQIGDESVVNSLLKKLEDEDDYVRKSAIEAIGNFVTPESTTIILPLIEAINEDKNWQVRQGAAGALIKIGQPAVPELLTAYQSAGPNQREHIAYALGKIQMEDPLKTQVIETLRETLSSENKSDALNAAVALYRLGVIEEAYNFALVELNDERLGTRESAAMALGEMGDERAVPALEKALQDSELFVRDAASVALEKITGKIYEYQH